LRQCEDKHIVKQIIAVEYDVVNIDVEIQQTNSKKNELEVQCLAV
jgi:hypothetical protein